MERLLKKSSWGPKAWGTFHAITLAYSKCPTIDDKRRMYSFLYSFARVLPCSTCRNDFEKILRDTVQTVYSEPLQSQKSFQAWGIRVHNKVNAKLGKLLFKNRPIKSKLISPKPILKRLMRADIPLLRGKWIKRVCARNGHFISVKMVGDCNKVYGDCVWKDKSGSLYNICRNQKMAKFPDNYLWLRYDGKMMKGPNNYYRQ